MPGILRRTRVYLEFTLRPPGYFVDFLNFASDFAPDQLSDSGKLASFQKNGAPNTLCFPWKFPETQSAGDPLVPLCALGCRKPLYRKKERKQTRQTRDGTRTGSPPARAGFWKNDQGDRWGSPAPDKGHDRLAARCAVDSHIHWRSHLSLATCLQLVAGSLSLPQAH